jgi:hypothetical protein
MPLTSLISHPPCPKSQSFLAILCAPCGVQGADADKQSLFVSTPSGAAWNVTIPIARVRCCASAGVHPKHARQNPSAAGIVLRIVAALVIGFPGRMDAAATNNFLPDRRGIVEAAAFENICLVYWLQRTPVAPPR